MMVSYNSFDCEEHISFGPKLVPSLDINDVLEEGERNAKEGLKFISNFANSPSFKNLESKQSIDIRAKSNFAFEISSKQNLVPLAFESSLQAHLKNLLRNAVKETEEVIINNLKKRPWKANDSDLTQKL